MTTGGAHDRPRSFSRVHNSFNRNNGSGWEPPDKDPAEAIKAIKADIEQLFRMVADLYNKLERVTK